MDVEKKKTDSWQEVKVTKKSMTAAEKKARTEKISQQVLKNADAVKVLAHIGLFHDEIF